MGVVLFLELMTFMHNHQNKSTKTRWIHTNIHSLNVKLFSHMSSFSDFNKKLEIADIPEKPEEQEQPSTSSTMSGDRPKRVGRKPGRRSSKMDVRAKLERSRQSARECRARKKMRYQYLEDLVANREKAVFALRNELEMLKQFCKEVDEGHPSDNLKEVLLKEQIEIIKTEED